MVPQQGTNVVWHKILYISFFIRCSKSSFTQPFIPRNSNAKEVWAEKLGGGLAERSPGDLQWGYQEFIVPQD